MKDKLIIVVDLGLVRAYRIDLTPQRTPRLQQLQQIVLDEAHTRLKDRVTDFAGRYGSPTQKNRGAPKADDHSVAVRRLPDPMRPKGLPYSIIFTEATSGPSLNTQSPSERWDGDCAFRP